MPEPSLPEQGAGEAELGHRGGGRGLRGPRGLEAGRFSVRLCPGATFLLSFLPASVGTRQPKPKFI